MDDLWPHQKYGIQETVNRIDAGANAICLASPTGAGKTRMMTELIKRWVSERHRVALYTNRRMLLDQTKDVLDAAGILHGIRASGHEKALLRDVQLCMTQTEGSQVYAREARALHRATRVLVDEAHIQKGETMERIIGQHREDGAAVVGFTATPLDIGHIYDDLIVAGTNSELRACGAHVPCYTYGPDEPDTRHIKKQPTGEYAEKDVRKVIMTPSIFARVLESGSQLNPDWRPAILFAPGVAESIWFAEQFHAAGISAAHIDGDDIWVNGETYKSTPEGRQDIMAASEEGRIKVLCNRFVLREGIDAPWLYHAIFATVFGALSSFLQSGGRLLRSHPSLDHVVLQDHGGNWWRHGSLNADREWRLDFTNNIASSLREKRIREKKEPEPITCPQCRAVRASGDTCNRCGFRQTTKSRMVVQVDGSLKEMRGDILKPRRVVEKPDTQKLWDKCFFGALKSGRTFAQAEAWFVQQHHYWPPHTLANMPVHDADWFRLVKKVDRSALTSEAQIACS